MKTAVLISGQMRTFAKCYPTQKWQIFRHYEPDIHFFVSCVDDAQADSVKFLSADYENVSTERYKDPIDLPAIPIEKGAFAPYANATSHEKLMLQHWGNMKVWKFWQSFDYARSFETIIRIRPDIWIHRFQKPRQPDESECFCPWWGKFGGVNDRLAIMGRAAAVPYFNVWSSIPCFMQQEFPFHPESLVAESLRTSGMIVHNTLMTEFSTERMDGSRRWAEIVMSDIAELIASR